MADETQFDDLPRGAKVVSAPGGGAAGQYSDLPAGAQVVHDPSQNTATERLSPVGTANRELGRQGLQVSGKEMMPPTRPQLAKKMQYEGGIGPRSAGAIQSGADIAEGMLGLGADITHGRLLTAASKLIKGTVGMPKAAGESIGNLVEASRNNDPYTEGYEGVQAAANTAGTLSLAKPAAAVARTPEFQAIVGAPVRGVVKPINSLLSTPGGAGTAGAMGGYAGVAALEHLLGAPGSARLITPWFGAWMGRELGRKYLTGINLPGERLGLPDEPVNSPPPVGPQRATSLKTWEPPTKPVREVYPAREPKPQGPPAPEPPFNPLPYKGKKLARVGEAGGGGERSNPPGTVPPDRTAPPEPKPAPPTMAEPSRLTPLQRMEHLRDVGELEHARKGLERKPGRKESVPGSPEEENIHSPWGIGPEGIKKPGTGPGTGPGAQLKKGSKVELQVDTHDLDWWPTGENATIRGGHIPPESLTRYFGPARKDLLEDQAIKQQIESRPEVAYGQFAKHHQGVWSNTHPEPEVREEGPIEQQPWGGKFAKSKLIRKGQ